MMDIKFVLAPAECGASRVYDMWLGIYKGPDERQPVTPVCLAPLCRFVSVFHDHRLGCCNGD